MTSWGTTRPEESCKGSAASNADLGLTSEEAARRLAEEGYNELTLATRRHLTGIVREVLSEGVRQRIPGREVARGDLIVVSEGDRVPADARLIETKHLEVDEAILTGESVPASKHAWRPENNLVPTPGGVGLSFIFSGTLVVKGDAIG